MRTERGGASLAQPAPSGSANLCGFRACSHERCNYRQQRSCGQGNIFKPVCHSFCSQGGSAWSWGVVVSQHALRQTPQPPTPQADPPQDQADPPRTRQNPPQDQADPPGPGRPLGPGRPPRDQADPPGTRQTPRTRQADTPQDQADPPRSRLQHTVYERPVRILLECILV